MSTYVIYELLKDGMTLEVIASALRLNYPDDFRRPGPKSLLALVLESAYEEYISSRKILLDKGN